MWQRPSGIGNWKQAIDATSVASFGWRVSVVSAVPLFDFGAGRLLGINLAIKIKHSDLKRARRNDHEAVLLELLSGTSATSEKEAFDVAPCTSQRLSAKPEFRVSAVRRGCEARPNEGWRDAFSA